MGRAITSSATVVVRSDLVSAPLGAETMMLDVDRGTYYWMDAIGTAVWEKLTIPTTVSALCTELQREFDVTPEKCEADVRAFLEEMHARGLVTVK